MKFFMTTCRCSNGTISIHIEDAASHIKFFYGSISVEEFGNMVTGLACRPVDAEVRGLEYIGKGRVVEERTAECPLQVYTSRLLEEWLRENCQEEGWILDESLDRRDSITYIKSNGNRLLHYRVIKYVASEGSDE